MRDGVYLGTLTDTEIATILQIRDTDCVEALTKSIYEFPLEIIIEALDNNISIRKLLKSKGIETSSYVKELRTYQTVGTAFMYFSKRSILGDGVGLGKTPQTASLLNVLRAKNEMTRFIMAVETSAIGQTHYELMRFTGLNIVSLPAEADKLTRIFDKVDWREVDGVIIKHSTLRSDAFSTWLAKYVVNGKSTMFDTFILDESSVIKNEKTKTFDYTKNICNIMNRVHFLNATTFETCLIDIFNQVDMMNPLVLHSKSRIQSNYCVWKTNTYWVREGGKPTMKYKREVGGYKNEAAFKESLKLFYFGRYKAQVMEETEAVYKVYEVLPSTEQQIAIARKHRYMEVLNCPSEIPEINIPFDRNHVPKLGRLIEIVENECQQLKIMIYCFHLEAQRVISNELRQIGRNPSIINGDTKDKERFEIMNDFNKGDCDVIITNIKKSLNLYGGDACIFYSVETNPAKMEQIRGRIDRSVDTRQKIFIMLVYAHTQEYTFMMDVVQRRAKDARALTIDARTAIDKFIESMEEPE